MDEPVLDAFVTPLPRLHMLSRTLSLLSRGDRASVKCTVMLMRLSRPIMIRASLLYFGKSNEWPLAQACFDFLPEAILEVMPNKDAAKVSVYVGWIEGTCASRPCSYPSAY